MKVLVIQLARLGDILLTIPSVRAIKRNYPDAEVHLLARTKFLPATTCFNDLDKVIEFPTEKILAPIVKESSNVEESLQELNHLLAELAGEAYTNIINLSFSPSSSYLTHYLSNATGAQTIGYTRHEDGFLNIPDDASAYFYAQVGANKTNRVHLSKLFANICGLELKFEDWKYCIEESEVIAPTEKYVLVHIGASQTQKNLTPQQWGAYLSEFNKHFKHKIVLVGAESEVESAQLIESYTECENLVGKTEFSDLFRLAQAADLIVGCDSVVMHIASFTNTRCLNFSFSCVSFWETGPISKDSEVLFFHEAADFRNLQAIAVTQSILNATECEIPRAKVSDDDAIVSYSTSLDTPEDKFQWQLVQAMYMGQAFPILDNPVTYKSLCELAIVTQTALDQVELMKQESKRTIAADLINQADSLIANLGNMKLGLEPIVAWFETEKLRIPPLEFNEVLNQTKEAYLGIKHIISMYIDFEDIIQHGEKNANTNLV